MNLTPPRAETRTLTHRVLGSLLLPAFFVVYILFFLGTVDGALNGDDHFALSPVPALLLGDRLNIEVFDIRLLVDTRRVPRSRFAALDLPCFSE